MALSSHESALRTKHQGLEAELQREQGRPSPDDSLIRNLKRKKLKIKEELAHLA